MPAVRVDHVTKKRGDNLALDGLSFEVEQGRIFGLIGPNGAGKTTCMQLLLGMLVPDSGATEVFGEPSLEMSIGCRQRIGYLPEDEYAMEDFDFPLGEILKFRSHLFENWDWDYCKELLASMHVDESKRLYDASKGERRNAFLLLALAHRPDLLVLDDPAIGLDVKARREILGATLETARERGTTVIFTSHILQDVERIVDDVLILDHGRSRLYGKLDELCASTNLATLEDLYCSVVGEPEKGSE